MGDLVTLIVGAVVTLMIFSYLLGDNVLYRWALALLAGSAAGYALGVAVRFVLNEWILQALVGQPGTEGLIYAVPLLLGSLLLLKGFSPTRSLGRISVIGNIPLGYLVGVGAGVAVSGAVLGTLIPQVLATGEAVQIDAGVLGIIQGVIIALGTILTLLYFSTTAREREDDIESRSTGARLIRGTGRFFLVFALGAAFSGALTSGLAAMVLRLWQLADLVSRLLAPFGG